LSSEPPGKLEEGVWPDMDSIQNTAYSFKKACSIWLPPIRSGDQLSWL